MIKRFVLLSTDCSNVARCMRPVKSATLQQGVCFAGLKKSMKSLQTDTNTADLQSWERPVTGSASNGKQASHLYGQMQLDGLCPNPFLWFLLFSPACTKCIKRKEADHE